MSDVHDPAESRIWPLARPDDQPALIADPIVQSFALILLTSVFFLLFPNVDLWFSGLFYQPGYGFPFGRLPISNGLRVIASDVTILIVVSLLVTLVVKLVLPLRAQSCRATRCAVRPRHAGGRAGSHRQLHLQEPLGPAAARHAGSILQRPAFRRCLAYERCLHLELFVRVG